MAAPPSAVPAVPPAPARPAWRTSRTGGGAPRRATIRRRAAGGTRGRRGRGTPRRRGHLGRNAEGRGGRPVSGRRRRRPGRRGEGRRATGAIGAIGAGGRRGRARARRRRELRSPAAVEPQRGEQGAAALVERLELEPELLLRQEDLLPPIVGEEAAEHELAGRMGAEGDLLHHRGHGRDQALDQQRGPSVRAQRLPVERRLDDGLAVPAELARPGGERLVKREQLLGVGLLQLERRLGRPFAPLALVDAGQMHARRLPVNQDVEARAGPVGGGTQLERAPAGPDRQLDDVELFEVLGPGLDLLVQPAALLRRQDLQPFHEAVDPHDPLEEVVRRNFEIDDRTETVPGRQARAAFVARAADARQVNVQGRVGRVVPDQQHLQRREAALALPHRLRVALLALDVERRQGLGGLGAHQIGGRAHDRRHAPRGGGFAVAPRYALQRLRDQPAQLLEALDVVGGRVIEGEGARLALGDALLAEEHLHTELHRIAEELDEVDFESGWRRVAVEVGHEKKP